MDPELSPWRRGPLSASSPSRDLSRAERPDSGSGERATPLLGGPQAPPQGRQRPREPPHSAQPRLRSTPRVGSEAQVLLSHSPCVDLQVFFSLAR